MGVGVHSIRRARGDVLDEAQAERAAAILVALEFADGGVGSLSIVESDNTGTAGSSAGLVLDLGLLNLADRREKLDQIIVAGRPGKLQRVSPREHAEFCDKGDLRCEHRWSQISHCRRWHSQ